ncbi:hypothetical protein ILYODFUR_031141 [Ilyodon furcidens]|uniref:Uncharacterized protein n=1 Tax=Ilyodon furcidens TaxID=33524 RepID=A0ABV0V7M7_9TELE
MGCECNLCVLSLGIKTGSLLIASLHQRCLPAFENFHQNETQNNSGQKPKLMMGNNPCCLPEPEERGLILKAHLMQAEEKMGQNKSSFSLLEKLKWTRKE